MKILYDIINKWNKFWSLSSFVAPPPPMPSETVFEYEEPLDIFNEKIDLDAYDATEAPITTTEPPIKGYGLNKNDIFDCII